MSNFTTPTNDLTNYQFQKCLLTTTVQLNIFNCH
jgi:hypothetical protein